MRLVAFGVKIKKQRPFGECQPLNRGSHSPKGRNTLLEGATKSALICQYGREPLAGDFGDHAFACSVILHLLLRDLS